MPIFLYSGLVYLLLPMVLLRLFWRSLREPAYREHLRQRFGLVDRIGDSSSSLIWVHAVSAGEVTAAVPLVRKLLHTGYRVLVTTMTPTGRERIRVLLGDRVTASYAPWDLPDALSRFLTRSRPACLLMIDTELWPNMIRQCSRRGISTMVVNGRLSEKSAQGYRRISWISSTMIRSIDKVAVQTRAHGERFLALGLPAERLEVTGSIKFHCQLPGDFTDRVSELRELTCDRPVIVAGSTHAGEEKIILDACRRIREKIPDLLLVLAPRHPHRCSEVESLLSDDDACIRHSELDRFNECTSIILLDVMGELLYYYGLAGTAFVGGSLVRVGGHNLMEAVCAGAAVVMGPFLHNIDDIAARFVQAGGLRIAENERQLVEAFMALLEAGGEGERQRLNATRVLHDNQGALEKVESLIADLMENKPE